MENPHLLYGSFLLMAMLLSVLNLLIKDQSEDVFTLLVCNLVVILIVAGAILYRREFGSTINDYLSITVAVGGIVTMLIISGVLLKGIATVVVDIVSNIKKRLLVK